MYCPEEPTLVLRSGSVYNLHSLPLWLLYRVYPLSQVLGQPASLPSVLMRLA